MPNVLKPDMILIPRPDLGYVILRKRDSAPAPEFHLHPIQALALSLLDGQEDISTVIAILSSVLRLERDYIEGFVTRTIGRYRQFLIPWKKVAQERLPAYNHADFIFETAYDFSRKYEPAPQTLMWIVTEDCDKRCRYCYKDAHFVTDGKASDLAFDLERMHELIEEARDIGVTTMILSGGEPFLRPDLVEVIDALVKADIKVIPITKSRITGERMQALAATGLEYLHVSLDAVQPELVAFITGVPNAHQQMIDTLKAAKTYGQSIVLRPVMTSYNIENLGEMVAQTYALGVRNYIIDIYGETCGRTDASFLLKDGQHEQLTHQRETLRQSYPDADFAFNFEKEYSLGGKGCMEGLRGLTILPDGKVTKCEHWRPQTDLEFGDLTHSSLMACWTSARLQEINQAPRSAYEGTICFHCKQFDYCNEVRGRCSLSSLHKHGALYHPDVYCPLGMFERRPGAKHTKNAETISSALPV